MDSAPEGFHLNFHLMLCVLCSRRPQSSVHASTVFSHIINIYCDLTMHPTIMQRGVVAEQRPGCPLHSVRPHAARPLCMRLPALPRAGRQWLSERAIVCRAAGPSTKRKQAGLGKGAQKGTEKVPQVPRVSSWLLAAATHASQVHSLQPWRPPSEDVWPTPK